MLGSLANVGSNQGVNIVINVFCGVAVNAAMGIAHQVHAAVNTFIANFQTAFVPQIIKSYVTKDFDYLQSLILRTSKLTSYLVLIFLVPLLFECSNVFTLWLGSYPIYAVEFCNLTLVFLWLSAMIAPLSMLVYGDKNIKKYQVVISSITATNFLFSWILLALGLPPYYIIGVKIVVDAFSLVARLYFAKHYLPTFNIGRWLYEVPGKGLLILSLSTLFSWRISESLVMPPLPHILVLTVLSCVFCSALILVLGLNKSERTFIFVSLKQLLKKIKS
jgi:O-antigen/teichoic acid export membrane protein